MQIKDFHPLETCVANKIVSIVFSLRVFYNHRYIRQTLKGGLLMEEFRKSIIRSSSMTDDKEQNNDCRK